MITIVTTDKTSRLELLLLEYFFFDSRKHLVLTVEVFSQIFLNLLYADHIQLEAVALSSCLLSPLMWQTVQPILSDFYSDLVP